MPDSLPSLPARKVVKAFKRCGFVEVRQKGSHLVLYNAETNCRIVIPMHHGKDVKKVLLRKIIQEEANLSVEEFLRLI